MNLSYFKNNEASRNFERTQKRYKIFKIKYTILDI